MTHTIAVIAFEGVSSFHLSIPCIVFGDDLLKLDAPRYNVMICAEVPGLIPTMSGFDINVSHDFSILTSANTIIMPAWRDITERPSAALLSALRTAHARGARLVGLCLGAFVLADAGLLDGRKSATHWAWQQEFEDSFHNVILDNNALYIEDDNIITSAGTAAAIDCCLHLVRRDHGAEIANRIARRLVVAPHRHGGQSQYIEKPLPQSEMIDKFSGILAWALEHLDQPHTLESLASHAHMSVRSFTRHFRKKTGTTLTSWLLNHRLQHAQRLLETGNSSIEVVAEQAGFTSVVSFRQHFTKAFSIPPGHYRKQFHL
ncbi:AraC family transcriptional regulator [Serratia sp. S1B]|nr:AraC family transcriptional regulator [Serratia sp. S1B]